MNKNVEKMLEDVMDELEDTEEYDEDGFLMQLDYLSKYNTEKRKRFDKDVANECEKAGHLVENLKTNAAALSFASAAGVFTKPLKFVGTVANTVLLPVTLVGTGVAYGAKKLDNGGILKRVGATTLSLCSLPFILPALVVNTLFGGADKLRMKSARKTFVNIGKESKEFSEVPELAPNASKKFFNEDLIDIPTTKCITSSK